MVMSGSSGMRSPSLCPNLGQRPSYNGRMCLGRGPAGAKRAHSSLARPRRGNATQAQAGRWLVEKSTTDCGSDKKVLETGREDRRSFRVKMRPEELQIKKK